MPAVYVINGLTIAIAVLIHYEFLWRMSAIIPRLRVRHRLRILAGVFGALVVHSIEIWLFALVYFLLHRDSGWGRLEGNFDGSLMDCFYFSATVFTTLGFGDIEPFGSLRSLVGLESLVGLVLITWTASFLFFEMQRNWGLEGP